MHLDEGEIRTYHDRQLDSAASSRVEAHLAACPGCHSRAEEIRVQAERVHFRLDGLDDAAHNLNPADARRRLAEQLHQELEQKEIQTMWKKLTSRISRPVWAGLALIAVLAIALAFPPVRAAANSFLQLFRVEQVRLLPVDMDALSNEMRSSEQLEALFTENVHVEDKGEAKETAVFDEAAALVDFPVRQLTGADGPTSYLVQPGALMTFKLDLNMARSALREMGRDDIQLPDSLDGAVVKVDASATVTTLIGDCAVDDRHKVDPDEPDQAPRGARVCTTFTQSPSPSVSAPPELNLNEIGQIYLQVLGMTEEEAGIYASSVDWATTLVMPVPQGNGEYEEVSVDGANGLFVNPYSYNSQDYTLMWVKNGIVYILSGPGDKAAALKLSASLK